MENHSRHPFDCRELRRTRLIGGICKVALYLCDCIFDDVEHLIDLGFRNLSRPTPVSSYVAVVDFEGYLHLLSQVDGDIVGRTKVDSSGARADMLVRGNRLFVYTNDGTLKAYDVETRN